MKKKISISIDEKTIKELDNKLNEGFFRNRSHIIELAVNKFINNTFGKSSQFEVRSSLFAGKHSKPQTPNRKLMGGNIKWE